MLYTLQNEKLTVQISDLGGEMQSIRTADGEEHLWQGDARYWDRRALILFPFCGRCYGGYATYHGEKCDPHFHGFLQHRIMKVTNKTDCEITFRLDSDEESQSYYPFAFSVTITYTLTGKTITVATRVENPGNSELIYGLGAHPGFLYPKRDGALEDQKLVFSGNQTRKVRFDPENCFPLGGSDPMELEADGSLALSEDQFTTGSFFLEEMPDTVTFTAEQAKHSITVSYPGFRYVGFWKEATPDARFLCIEPWCSMPSTHGEITELSEKEDLLRLNPGESDTNTFTVTVD